MQAGLQQIVELFLAGRFKSLNLHAKKLVLSQGLEPLL
jgi:hypothetical protein